MDLDINAKKFDTDSDLYNGNVKESIETPKEPEHFKIERDDAGACVSIHLLDPILVRTMQRYLPRSGLYEAIPKVVFMLFMFGIIIKILHKNDFCNFSNKIGFTT